MSTTERTRALRRRMVVEARRATIEHGVHGFTIEQLCETVGVSRRTFFNHFASKDDAVLGIELDAGEELLVAYAAGGVVPADLDPLGSIVAMAVEQFHRVGIDRTDEAMVRRVFEREPALVARFLSATDAQLVKVADAVAQRFGWTAPDDRRARLVTETAAGLLRVTAGTYFDGDDSSGPSFADLLTENLRLVRETMAATGVGPETDPVTHSGHPLSADQGSTT